MHVYQVPPMDFGWELLPTIEDAATSKIADEGFTAGFQYMTELNEMLMSAFRLAEISGYDGEMVGDVHVMAIPNGDPKPSLSFVWKAVSNGTTFVVSPIAFSHLAKFKA